MRKLLIFLVLIALIVTGGYFALRMPAVQEAIFDRGVTARINAPSPFTENALQAYACGTAAPLPSNRAQACIAVVAGQDVYIVDAGSGSIGPLAASGFLNGNVQGIFLTHYHSDHFSGIPDINLNTWAGGRSGQLKIFGPGFGVKRIVDGLNAAYLPDRAYRVAHHGADLLHPQVGLLAPVMFGVEVTDNPEGAVGAINGEAVASEDSEGEAPKNYFIKNSIAPDFSRIIFNENDMVVTAFAVEHDPVEPAVGYRFDYKGRSIVVSGDTIKSANLIKHSKDVDLLFHEALAPHMVNKMKAAAIEIGNKRMEKIMHDILDYHATPVEAAESANEAGAKHLVLYHLAPAPPDIVLPYFAEGVKDVRTDNWEIANDGDLWVLPLGSDEIKKK